MDRRALKPYYFGENSLAVHIASVELGLISFSSELPTVFKILREGDADVRCHVSSKSKISFWMSVPFHFNEPIIEGVD